MNMKVLGYHKIVKQFPECPKEVPFDLFNEDWAMKMHGQTLKRLNERGGLSPNEMILNIEKLPFDAIYTMQYKESIAKLNIYLKSKVHA